MTPLPILYHCDVLDGCQCVLVILVAGTMHQQPDCFCHLVYDVKVIKSKFAEPANLSCSQLTSLNVNQWVIVGVYCKL